jgi:tryptophanyl-tRNA synthetase
MPRLSGFQPTGSLQLGNYLGAIRPMVDSQDDHDTIVLVVNLHALTVEHDPQQVRRLTRENAAILVAAGLDPARTLLYAQADVAAHLELHYLLECATGYGEAHRMIQFKEKNTGDHTRLSLLTYPVLMAADILLHHADEVPVGVDQSQHLELARSVATRFNARYGEVFTVPRAVLPATAPKVRDLADPTTKMGKTNASKAGVLHLLDPADTIRRKVMRAVTDDLGVVRHDPATQPGVSNLLEILAALRGESPDAVARGITTYRQLKETVADEVIAVTDPIRHHATQLTGSEIDKILDDGAQRARERTAPTLRRAYEALGLR